jgi:hypothetical protein
MKEETFEKNVGVPTSGKANGKWAIEKGASQDFEVLQKQVVDTVKLAFAKVMQNSSAALASVNSRAGEIIRRYPTPVAMGALVAGFLAGTWVSRRRG